VPQLIFAPRSTASALPTLSENSYRTETNPNLSHLQSKPQISFLGSALTLASSNGFRENLSVHQFSGSSKHFRSVDTSLRNPADHGHLASRMLN